MNRKPILIVLILSIALQGGLSGQNIQSPDALNLAISTVGDLNTNPALEQESEFRRMEVIFLLSLPFTAIMSFLVLNAAYAIADPAYLDAIAMTKLPHEILPFSVFSAVFASSIITYADYRTVQNKKKQDIAAESQNKTHEFQLGLGFQKRF